MTVVNYQTPLNLVLPQLKFIVPSFHETVDRAQIVANHYQQQVVPKAMEWLATFLSINPTLFPAHEITIQSLGSVDHAFKLLQQGDGYRVRVDTFLPQFAQHIDAYLSEQDKASTITVMIVDYISKSAVPVAGRVDGITFMENNLLVLAFDDSPFSADNIEYQAKVLARELLHLMSNIMNASLF